MIAPHHIPATADRPARDIWVALMFILELGTWRPLSAHDTPLQAGRACVRAFHHAWHDIHEQARKLLAFTERPDVVAFASKSGDGQMLGSQFQVNTQTDSGQRSPELSITKSGDRLLRQLLVQCAQYILGRHGEDSALRRWGLRLAGRGGKAAKRKAVVAVARKLAVLLHVLWKRDTDFDPFHGTSPQAVN